MFEKNIEKAFLEGDIVSDELFHLWWPQHGQTPFGINAQVRTIRTIQWLSWTVWAFCVAASTSMSSALAALIFIAGFALIILVIIPLTNLRRSDLRFVKDCRRLKELTEGFTPALLSEAQVKEKVIRQLQMLTGEIQRVKDDHASRPNESDVRIRLAEEAGKLIKNRGELYELATRFRIVSPSEDQFYRFAPTLSPEAGSVAV
jgi:uncharacterized membrane protein YciS (DUF1049 family)